MTTDITELAQRTDLLMDNALETAKQLRELSESSVAEAIFESIVENENGKEIQFERPISDLAYAAFWQLERLAEALEKAQQRNAELEAQNEYIRKRYQQLDLLIGKNILVMQAAIIEWQATGDAKNGLAWIYNTLFGPGELPDEAEKDAQVYFDRKYAPLDEELMALHKWFWEQSEAERAAAGIKVEAE